jgi:serine/threonine protein kinase
MSDEHSTRVREILAEIAAQPPARWRPLLDASFPDDPTLVAQALLWLRVDRERIADDAAPPALDSNRYALRVRLDAGASAAVWQAYDRKLGRDVAIKLFHVDDDEVVAAALAEARAACDVVGDHVVRVLDVHDSDERPYIVMELVGEHDPHRGELVPGGSAAMLRPRSIDEAVCWVRDVARGVHDAHLRNVFHRDLKPHNVLVTPISRRARIADFGLAISASRAAERGRIAGTPEYMAPEQVHAPRALDPGDGGDRARLVAIDVWGLGALAYDLIGGRPPWLKHGDREPWELAASGDVPPPLEHVPARLARAVAKAMALVPNARYASAAELAHELDAYLARRPTSLDRSLALRVWLWCRRNPQLTLTAAAAFALAALTLIAYVAVVELRDQSRELARDNAGLEERMQKARAELATTEAEVTKQGQALGALQRALADETRTYSGILAARDKALHQADAATRQLVDELAIARNDRAAAELGRDMYEGFFTSARHDADRAAKDRDQAQKERDAARTERDQLQHERDAARVERDRLQAERDRAAADVKRLDAAAVASAARIAELERQLASAAVPAHAPPADAGAAAVVIDGAASR